MRARDLQFLIHSTVMILAISVPPHQSPCAADATSTIESSTRVSAATSSLRISGWKPPRFEDNTGRDAMVRHMRVMYGLTDEAVLKAMAQVPRHEFVPKELAGRAYNDSPLPIGHGQTISQPFIVGEMTRLLKLTPESKVLEIGTGSGYQAAVLTEFTRRVFSIEIIEPLYKEVKDRLGRLGYDAVQLRYGDGYDGWPEEAPFDAIIVTAAAGEIPPPLIRQLKTGGKMVIPVGAVFATQTLLLVEKDQNGQVRTRDLMPVTFVPLVRQDKSVR